MALFSGHANTPAARKAPMLQRACACRSRPAAAGPCETCRKKRRLQRAAESGSRVDSGVALQADPRLCSGGFDVPQHLRNRLEPLYGSDFGHVRLHDDALSHQASTEVRARAFTLGSHVHFARGAWRPDEPDGMRLLAHELAHTLQQGPSAGGDAALDVDDRDSPLERAADQTAERVLAGQSARVPQAVRGGGLVQRAAEGTVERRVSDDEQVSITRSLEERPCRVRPETVMTPRTQIFYWDREADAIGLRYEVCHGSVRLTTDTAIDYTRVLEAGERLLDTLRSNPALGTDPGGLLRQAIDSAVVDMRGQIRFTVDRTFELNVTGEGSAGTATQSVRVRGQVIIAPGGDVRIIIEGGVGLDQDRVRREVEAFVRGELRVGPVSLSIEYRDIGTTPSGGTTTRERTVTGRLGVDVGPVRPELRVTGGPGESTTVTGGVSVPTERPTPRRVDCRYCDCPPPLVSYRCTRTVRPHTERRVEQTADQQTVRLLYAYDSPEPANAAEHRAQVESIAAMLGSHYRVADIRGYASPEASVAYNQRLGQRRADHARRTLQSALTGPSAGATLPAARGVGELLGESSRRPGESSNAELVRELSARLAPLGDEERLALLGVDGARRTDPALRAQTLADVQAFIDGHDVGGRRLGTRARWERIFPFLRRVDVDLQRPEVAREVPVGGSTTQPACTEADRAFADAELGAIPTRRRLPREMCSP